ncbi:PREDICTED: 60 kDa SS-A/Ro ribonucleoprotein-like [Nicrophorus vespilloides]|uniref:60 kDa SS-A/Ro ribonucleoprotein-like n=1 Tax=Nicrophorus vespilloides TaxID=110193 RepID=A0ABM1MM64_NICVS|nr:PREDICTED: 60 kDa SS-A/Ro ribonucleoprotein-like [Nicrophorus vespilloides]
MEQTSKDVMEPKVAPEILLKQFLYLSNTIGYNLFFTGKPETHKNFDAWSLPFITDLLKSGNPHVILNIIENTNGLDAIPNRETLFYVLALITLAETTPAFKHHVYRTTLQVIRNDEDFFNYIKFVTRLNKTFSKGINKIIARYYLNKEPKQLLKDFGCKNGYHGWTHKDLIKLSHLKSKDLFTNAILDYVLRGSASGIIRANGDKEALSAIEYLDKCKEYRKCLDDDTAAEMLSELNYDITYPPDAVKKPLKVWETLIEHMDLKDVIRNLVKFYKLYLLKLESSFCTKLIDILTNEEKIKQSKLQPLDVFIALKLFENGGKSRDPHLVKYLTDLKAENDKVNKKQNIITSANILISDPISCPHISNVLNLTLQMSTCNFETTGKRFLINIVLDKTKCTTLNNINCDEAAAIITVPYVIAEKDVIVTKQLPNECVDFDIDFSNFKDAVNALKKANKLETDIRYQKMEFDYAIENQKLVDVFIHISGSPVQNIKSTTESFNKYKEIMKMPSAKLVLLNFYNTRKKSYDESILSIQGFDTNIPKIINAFIKNLF